MNHPLLVTFLSAATLVACSSGPVKLDRNTLAAAPVDGQRRSIESEACGFQLLYLVPLGVNSQHRRAVEKLYEEADGDYVQDIRLVDHWGYGFVGTNYCVQLTATAVHPNETTVPPAAPVASVPAAVPGPVLVPAAPLATAPTPVPVVPSSTPAAGAAETRLREAANLSSGPTPKAAPAGRCCWGRPPTTSFLRR